MKLDHFGIKLLSSIKLAEIPYTWVLEFYNRTGLMGGSEEKELDCYLSYFEKEDPGYFAIVKGDDPFAALYDGQVSSVEGANIFDGWMYLNGALVASAKLTQSREFARLNLRIPRRSKVGPVADAFLAEYGKVKYAENNCRYIIRRK